MRELFAQGSQVFREAIIVPWFPALIFCGFPVEPPLLEHVRCLEGEQRRASLGQAVQANNAGTCLEIRGAAFTLPPMVTRVERTGDAPQTQGGGFCST